MSKAPSGDLAAALTAGVVLLVIGVPIVLYLVVKATAYFVGKSLRSCSKGLRARLRARLTNEKERVVIIGFFHPYCNAGGGGERVLWKAVEAIQEEYSNVISVVYTGDVGSNKEEILSKVSTRFDITLQLDRIEFVYLRKRYLVSAEAWPRFTLLGQSLGSIPLIYEALSTLVPDIYIDTMGYAFTIPVVSMLLDVPTAAYVHYPTISTDMLSKIPTINFAKRLYWKAFALLYSIAGNFTDVVMANSTWTARHVQSLWWMQRGKIGTIYPPTDCDSLQTLDVEKERAHVVLCIAQFRPEKKHELLIEAMAVLHQEHKMKAKLEFIGSVRDDADRRRVYELRLLAHEKGLEESLSIQCEVSWQEIKQALSKASVGANAMWNEHFGIGVVEYMAAGLIPVVHSSGGPKLDIVVPLNGEQTGFCEIFPS